MSHLTTIGIQKTVQKRLLKFIHKLENEKEKRFGYSEAINFLLDEIEERKQ